MTYWQRVFLLAITSVVFLLIVWVACLTFDLDRLTESMDGSLVILKGMVEKDLEHAEYMLDRARARERR